MPKLLYIPTSFSGNNLPPFRDIMKAIRSGITFYLIIFKLSSEIHPKQKSKIILDKKI